LDYLSFLVFFTEQIRHEIRYEEARNKKIMRISEKFCSIKSLEILVKITQGFITPMKNSKKYI